LTRVRLTEAVTFLEVNQPALAAIQEQCWGEQNVGAKQQPTLFDL
jgi:hypothetical protein